MAVARLNVSSHAAPAVTRLTSSPLARLAQQSSQRRAAGWQPASLADLGRAAAGPGLRFSIPARERRIRARAAATYAGAISRIESGGNYDELGPVTKTGDRAYGKISNHGGKRIFRNGRGPRWAVSMTPQEFLADTQCPGCRFQASVYSVRQCLRAWWSVEGVVCRAGRHEQPERQRPTRDVGC